MRNLVQLYNLNRQTFYNFDTQKLNSVWPKYTILLLFSLTLAALFGSLKTDLVSGALALLAIMASFGFGIQFFLVSNEIKVDVGKGVIEDKLLRTKLEKLAEELFDNVSYLNMISMIGVCVCILHTIELDFASLENFLGTSLNPFLKSAYFIFGRAIFFFLLLELILTYVRISGRVSYLFRKIREPN